jgi:uncharacterized SAM-binding protein YcdF (DUF218 family)
VENIVHVCLMERCGNIGIVTVGVHLPRAAMFLHRYLMSRPELSHLRVHFFESEEVLGSDPSYRERIARLRSSTAFERTWAREANGIQHLLRGTY